MSELIKKALTDKRARSSEILTELAVQTAVMSPWSSEDV
jgi:hypothetical protein